MWRTCSFASSLSVRSSVAIAARPRARRAALGRRRPRLRRDADEDVGLAAAAQPIVELGDDAPADRGAELAERARPLRDGDRRAAPRALRRPRRARPRSAADRSSCWRRSATATSGRPPPASCPRPSASARRPPAPRPAPARARVVEDVLDRRADLVVRRPAPPRRRPRAPARRYARPPAAPRRRRRRCRRDRASRAGPRPATGTSRRHSNGSTPITCDVGTHAPCT